LCFPRPGERTRVTSGAQAGSRKEASTPNHAEGVSVYYPFALLELIDIGKTDEHAETGEVLLYFRDSDHCRVTIRLSEYAFEQLRTKLSAPLQQ
jgi:hypothetical protein